jgi:hypothetical protein
MQEVFSIILALSYEQFTITITIAHNSQPVAHSKKSHPLKQTSPLYVI